eukprot:g79518.t1
MLLELSRLESLITCALLALCFVGSLYVWGGDVYNRNDPTVIKRRFISVLVVSFSSPFVLLLFHTRADLGPPWLSWIGLRADKLGYALLLPLCHAGLLFAGSLLLLLLEGELNPRVQMQAIQDTWRDPTRRLIALRTYGVGPLTEEIVFRGAMTPLLAVAGWPFSVRLLTSPLLFALAHSHHLFNLVLHMGYSRQQAILNVVFQLFYTSLFGLYASFIFLRTGHLVAPLVVHMFCNYMGFPDTGWITDSSHFAYAHRYVVGAVFLLGIFAFIVSFPYLTAPALYNCCPWDTKPKLA